MSIEPTTAESNPWEQVGWLKGSIRMALEYLDSDDIERAKRVLSTGLASLEGGR